MAQRPGLRTCARGASLARSGRRPELAEVSVNGTPLGVVWKRPFRVEITRAAKAGANSIEVKVTNVWVNRMIGDRQPGAATQYIFTRPTFYKADSPLLPSGLLGPVRLVHASEQGR